jgi:hypothetical protein
MVATLDGTHTAYGVHQGLNQGKINVGLTGAGESAYFKSLQVWDASAHADWAATKTKRLAERGKK